MINFGRPPTKKERSFYKRWVKYLSDSKLSKDEVHRRAAYAVNHKQKIPNA